MSKLGTRVMEILKDGPLTRKELDRKLFDKTPYSINSILRDMLTDGYIKNVSNGRREAIYEAIPWDGPVVMKSRRGKPSGKKPAALPKVSVQDMQAAAMQSRPLLQKLWA